ncbi:MAG: DUF1684 domain-containing protein [Thermomonas sp.]|uniref:DUF1684 domain-containing protein n=1 Tax=Thermomonas sp. TaxID=1971895 RepID=UPI0039E6E41D
MVPARTLNIAGILLACMMALTGCQRAAPPPTADQAAREEAAAKAYAREQFMWRGRRVIELSRPDGWASLIGLHWLDPGAHRVGSARDNGIRLMMGPAHLGVFTVKDGKARFVADTAVTLDGKPTRSGALRSDADEGGPSVLAFDDGKGLASVIERGGRLALRVKHADADSRVNFTGLDYWPGGRGWQVQAHFIAHPAGKTLPIANIIGITDNIANPGVVEFQRGDKLYRLEALDTGGEGLFLIFADRTSGHGSYGAGRYLDTPKPDAEGKLLLDFNQAYNPPCAFTPFATCPLPPNENRLDLAVEAGEREYRKPATSTKDNQ